MRNITLLSLTIASSFQNSPFMKLSHSSVLQNVGLYNINARNFQSSFLSTNSFHTAYIANSNFERFLTHIPVLSLAHCTPVKDNIFSGYHPENENAYDEIFKLSHGDNSYSTVTNCVFQSISDDGETKEGDNHGCIIYSSCSQVSVTSCFFFAILSFRSGGCIAAATIECSAVVSQCTFRSVTLRTSSSLFNGYVNGACVCLGENDIKDSVAKPAQISKGQIEYCTLIGNSLEPAASGHVNGLLQIIANEASSTGINITRTAVSKTGTTNGLISSICYNSMTLSQISMTNNQLGQSGCFYFFYTKLFTLQDVNLFNNTFVTASVKAIITLQSGTEAKEIDISNVYCNSRQHFLGFAVDAFLVNGKITNVTTSGKLIDPSLDNRLMVMESNVVTDSTDVKPTNLSELDSITSSDLPSTVEFSPSSKFTPISKQNSATMFDLRGDSQITAGVLATIFGILSFIAYLFLLYIRRGNAQKFHVVGTFENRDDFDQIYTSSESGSAEKSNDAANETNSKYEKELASHNYPNSKRERTSTRPSTASSKKGTTASSSRPKSKPKSKSNYDKKDKKDKKNKKDKRDYSDYSYGGYSYGYDYSYSYSDEKKDIEKL